MHGSVAFNMSSLQKTLLQAFANSSATTFWSLKNSCGQRTTKLLAASFQPCLKKDIRKLAFPTLQMTFLVPCTGGLERACHLWPLAPHEDVPAKVPGFPTTNQPALWDKCSTERLREKPTIRTNTLEMLK